MGKDIKDVLEDEAVMHCFVAIMTSREAFSRHKSMRNVRENIVEKRMGERGRSEARVGVK